MAERHLIGRRLVNKFVSRHFVDSCTQVLPLACEYFFYRGGHRVLDGLGLRCRLGAFSLIVRLILCGEQENGRRKQRQKNQN